MGTHLNCIYEEVDKKYTGCNLKTADFLDCVLIGVCAVIRSNTVICLVYYTLIYFCWLLMLHGPLHLPVVANSPFKF